jgi:hypothetical protein
VQRALAREATSYARRMDARAQLGRYLDRTLSENETYLIGDAGIVPYLSHTKVIDAFCLNSREMTSPEIHFDRQRFLNWVFSQRPEVLVVHSTSATTLRPRREYGFYPALVRDRRFLRDCKKERVIGAPRDDFQYWAYRCKQ